jgi:Flp pilus assembly protein TadD
MEPNYPQTHNNMAVALAKMGRFPEAIEQFKAELELYPNDESTRENMEKVETMQKSVQGKH